MNTTMQRLMRRLRHVVLLTIGVMTAYTGLYAIMEHYMFVDDEPSSKKSG